MGLAMAVEAGVESATARRMTLRVRIGSLSAALLATILVTAPAAWRHVRQALALRPIEALA